MLQEYPEIDPVAIERQGRTFIFCDHIDVTPQVREGVKKVTEDMVGQPRPEGIRVPVQVGDQGVWLSDEVGVIYDRGIVTEEETVGEPCTAHAEVFPEERTRQVGRSTVIDTFAPLPEGWASSSDNALDGAADFCPAHADRIVVVPAGDDVQPDVPTP